MALQLPAFRGRFGIARFDITPPVGVYSRNWGAAKHDTAESIHRPLGLTVLTFAEKSGGPPLVFLDADLGWWRPLTLFYRLQKCLLEEFSLPSERLIFGLSHTHAGPPLMEADDSLPGGELLQEWLDSFFETAVETVRDALGDPFSGILEWGTGTCDLAAVRDFPDPDPDRHRMICGFEPAGEPDDTLWVGRLTDESGKARATIVNYACHPTTLAWENRAISPDYPGAMRELVESKTGAPTLFFLGACGELAPRNQYVGDTEIADRNGRQLGFAALAVLESLDSPGTEFEYAGTVESGAPLAVWKSQPRGEFPETISAVRRMVSLPLKNWPSAAELENERAANEDRALEERLRRKRDIRRTLGDGDSFDLPIYAWRMGDAALVGCCCEGYSILQKEIRSRFPDRAIFCLNLINGSIGYLPPADLYDVDVYPVWQTPFDRGCLENVIESMCDALSDVFAGE
ncbi:MAG: alkaline ceramidase [Verrucomicrobiales bacterium]|nr:alkaline ceramidase [Verrucomicrobiales bacterium]